MTPRAPAEAKPVAKGLRRGAKDPCPDSSSCSAHGPTWGWGCRVILGPCVPGRRGKPQPQVGLPCPSWVLPVPTERAESLMAESPPPKGTSLLPPKIAQSHHVPRASPHLLQIPLKLNPHPAPSRMAPPAGAAGLPPGEAGTAVLHGDRDINPQIMRQALGTQNQTRC